MGEEFIMILLSYVIIILIATISGAIAGLGGGVIIKPLFDMIAFHDASTIGFYSSVAVFTMCIVSIYKQVKNGFKFDIRTVLSISIGSMVGGLLGELIFNSITKSLDNSFVKVIQAGILAITLIVILLYTLNREKIKGYKINNVLIIFGAGMFLGLISIFLGIGGGPLNVALLMLLFSYPMKEASIYSIATIFFSQISKLGSILFSGQIVNYDLSFIPFIAVTAIIGGFIGTSINQKLEDEKIQKFYIFLIGLLLLISGYNVISNI